MSRRISWFLCFTSTQKHSTWNIYWIRSEQYWCGGHSGRCWRSKNERKIGNLQTFLTDTEMEIGKHRVFNFAMLSIDMSLLNGKLDYVFKELKCAAKVNLAFGFVLKNIEDGMCRYFYAHENNTIMERAKLVYTQADMTNLKDRMQKMDIVDICTGERANTKWKFNNFCLVTQRCTHGL